MKEQVLVISRSPSLKKLVERGLAAEEIEVTTAAELPDIYSFAKSFHPSVIVYDLVNPVKDEFIRVHALKTHENLKETPVVFIVGTPRLLYRYQLLGPRDSFVTRHFESKLLVKRIKELVGRLEPKEELEEIPAEAYAPELWETAVFGSLEREEASWAEVEPAAMPEYAQALLAPPYWEVLQEEAAPSAELGPQEEVTLEPMLLLPWAMAPSMEEELSLAVAREEELDPVRFREKMGELMGRLEPREEPEEIIAEAYAPEIWEATVFDSLEREEATWAELEPASQPSWEVAPSIEGELELAVAREEELDWTRFMEKMGELSDVSYKERTSKYETVIETLQRQIKTLEQQLLQLSQRQPPASFLEPKEIPLEAYGSRPGEEAVFGPWEGEEELRIQPLVFWGIRQSEFAGVTCAELGPVAEPTLEPVLQLGWEMAPLIEGEQRKPLVETYATELWAGAILSPVEREEPAWAELESDILAEGEGPDYAQALQVPPYWGIQEEAVPPVGLAVEMEPTLEPALQVAWEAAPLMEEGLDLAFAREEEMTRARLEMSLLEYQEAETETWMVVFPAALESLEFGGVVESSWTLSTLEMGEADTESVLGGVPIFGPLEAAEAEEEEPVVFEREKPIPEPREEKGLEEEAPPGALPSSLVEQLARALKEHIKQDMEEIAERVAKRVLAEQREVKEPEEGLLEESKPDWLVKALAESKRDKKK